MSTLAGGSAIIAPCRVLIVSPFGTAVNPYIGLFSGGLTAAGAEVRETRRLEPADLSAAARPAVIHLHWVEQYDRPAVLQPRAKGGPARTLQRVALRPLNAGLGYEARRWQRFRALFARLAAFRRTGGRVAYTVHNLDPHEAGSPPERWALGKMIATADILHVHDVSTAEAIGDRYGRRTGVVVIPHGHYLTAYPNEVGRAGARARLALPEGAFVFVCLGQMRPYKGLEELLPAFRQLAGDSARLLVAGRPPDESYLQRLRGLAADDGRVTLEPRFIPPEEVQIYLNAADIAVLPYRQITTSGAALLAFSFGLPVIAPAIGAFPNLVRPERGILYEPGRLLDAMRSAPRTDWTQTRPATLAWVGQFDWGEIGRRLLEAYIR